MSDKETKVHISLVDKVSETLKKVKDGFGEGMESVLKYVGPLGLLTAGYEGVKAAIGKTIEYIKEAIANAKEDQAVDNETIRIVEQVGTVHGTTTQQIRDTSKAISDKVALGVADIQSGINILAQNPKLVASYDDVAEAAANISAAQNSGVLTADGYKASISNLSTILSGDLSNAMTKLHKQGIDFNSVQQESIQAAIKSGDAQKAQEAVLKALGENYKNAASNTSSLEYQQRRAQTASDELKGAIGAYLLPIVVKLQTTFANVTVAINKFVSENKDVAVVLKGIGATILTVVDTLIFLAKQVGYVGSTFLSFGKVLKDIMAGNFKGIQVSFQEFSKTTIDNLKKMGDATKDYGKTVAKEWKDEEKGATAHAKKIVANEKKKAADILKISKDAEKALDKLHKDAEQAELRYQKNIQALDKASGDELKKIKEQIALDEKTLNDARRADELVQKINANTTQQEVDKINRELTEAEEKASLDKRIATAEEADAKRKQAEKAKSETIKAENQARMDIETGAADFLNALEQTNLGKSRDFFEIKKGASMGLALMKGAETIANIWAGSSSLGPWGVALAVVQTAVAAAVTAAQIATITSQQFPAAAQQAFADDPGKGANVKFGEAGPEWIVNQGGLKEIVKETIKEMGNGNQNTNGSQTTTIHLDVNRKTLQTWIKETEKEKNRMDNLGNV